MANHEMHNGRSRRSRNLKTEYASKGRVLNRTRAQRIPSRPGVNTPKKAEYISADHTPPFSFFACKTAADHTRRVAGYAPTASFGSSSSCPLPPRTSRPGPIPEHANNKAGDDHRLDGRSPPSAGQCSPPVKSTSPFSRPTPVVTNSVPLIPIIGQISGDHATAMIAVLGRPDEDRHRKE